MNNYTLHYQRQPQNGAAYIDFITVKKNGFYFKTFVIGYEKTMHEAIAAATEAVSADIVAGQLPPIDVQIAEVNLSAE
jgi:hypothetical protein